MSGRASPRFTLIADELRKGQSYVTPGGLLYWPALDALREMEAELAAAVQALGEARPYVYNVACEHGANWRGQTAEDVLARVDAALAAVAGGGP